MGERQILVINCEDTNGTVITFSKYATLFTPSGAPVTINLPCSAKLSAGTWTITVLNNDFVKWIDTESSNPTRQFTMVDDSPAQTYVAVFQAGGSASFSRKELQDQLNTLLGRR